MMQAFIVCGGNPKEREGIVANLLDEWHIARFDRVRIQKESSTIGISDIRNFERNLSFTPFTREGTVGIVPNADCLTLEAQQAVLKTLEEPPGQTRIILEVANENSLLPTIQSRCQIIHAHGLQPSTVLPGLSTLLISISDLSPGDRLREADKLAKSIDNIKAWNQTIIVSLHETLHLSPEVPMSVPQIEVTRILRLAIQMEKELSANISSWLSLDLFFLAL